jgi:hypothetical protein
MANSSCLVKMRIDGLNVTLTAEDIDFSKKANDYFLATDSNKNITIGLKGIFFKLCLDAILSDNVKIEMNKFKTAEGRALKGYADIQAITVNVEDSEYLINNVLWI